MSEARVKMIRKELKKFSYVPGYRMKVVAHGDLYAIFVSRPTRDSNSRRIRKGVRVEWSGWTDDRFLFPHGRLVVSQLKMVVIDAVRCLEMHELDEWLRYDGKSLHSPHFV